MTTCLVKSVTVEYRGKQIQQEKKALVVASAAIDECLIVAATEQVQERRMRVSTQRDPRGTFVATAFLLIRELWPIEASIKEGTVEEHKLESLGQIECE